MRAGNAIPEDLGKPEEMRALGALGPYPGLHSAGQPGILALDVSPSDQVLTGASGSAAVFNKDTEQVVAVLKGHPQNVRAGPFSLSLLGRYGWHQLFGAASSRLL